MSAQQLGMRLKAINELVRCWEENDDDASWQQAFDLYVKLSDELDTTDIDLTVVWAFEFKRYVLKWE